MIDVVLLCGMAYLIPIVVWGRMRLDHVANGIEWLMNSAECDRKLRNVQQCFPHEAVYVKMKHLRSLCTMTGDAPKREVADSLIKIMEAFR